jgi:hypothetical protein
MQSRLVLSECGDGRANPLGGHTLSPMHIYWSRKSIPELAGLPRPQRRRAWRSSCWKAYRHWQVWLGLFVCFLCTVLGCAIGDSFISNGPLIINDRFVWPSRVPLYIGALIGSVIGTFIFLQVLSREMRPYLRSYLHSEDHWYDLLNAAQLQHKRRGPTGTPSV